MRFLYLALVAILFNVAKRFVKFCEQFELGPVVKEEMSFKDISVLSS